MGGVKTCSTGCSKNDPEFDGAFSTKRRNKKKTATKLNIESNASMGYSNMEKQYNQMGMNGETNGDLAFGSNNNVSK
jgi:hypothetical protein